MSGFRVKRHVRHSADRMFDLVADVERYEEFVPFCRKHALVSRAKCADGGILATYMTVAGGIFCETFRSRVLLDRTHGRILVESGDGPMRRLRVLWTFRPSADASCDVEFDLSYEFASRTLALLLGGMFEAAFSCFVQAFERRADLVYGRGKRSSPRRSTELTAAVDLPQ
jgi:coenzyme Q-binding protein COQ10